MNIIQHLQQAIDDYELVNQHKPTRLIISWDLRAELARQDALPDMEVVNSTAPFSVLRVE